MPVRDRIKALEGDFTIRNASGKTVPIVGNILLFVHIGTLTVTFNFLVAKTEPLKLS